jgi:hypothetical protein
MFTFSIGIRIYSQRLCGSNVKCCHHHTIFRIIWFVVRRKLLKKSTGVGSSVQQKITGVQSVDRSRLNITVKSIVHLGNRVGVS